MFELDTLERGPLVKKAYDLDYSKDDFYWLGDSGSTTVASAIFSCSGAAAP